MAHPLVVHKNDPGGYDVYVGRPTEWGNPYTHTGRTSKFKLAYSFDTVEEAVEAFRQHLWRRINNEGETLIYKLSLLHGKKLACWCAPGPCHAEVLVAAAEWAKNWCEENEGHLRGTAGLGSITVRIGA